MFLFLLANLLILLATGFKPKLRTFDICLFTYWLHFTHVSSLDVRVDTVVLHLMNTVLYITQDYMFLKVISKKKTSKLHILERFKADPLFHIYVCPVKILSIWTKETQCTEAVLELII